MFNCPTIALHQMVEILLYRGFCRRLNLHTHTHTHTYSTYTPDTYSTSLHTNLQCIHTCKFTQHINTYTNSKYIHHTQTYITYTHTHTRRLNTSKHANSKHIHTRKLITHPHTRTNSQRVHTHTHTRTQSPPRSLPFNRWRVGGRTRSGLWFLRISGVSARVSRRDLSARRPSAAPGLKAECYHSSRGRFDVRTSGRPDQRREPGGGALARYAVVRLRWEFF